MPVIDTQGTISNSAFSFLMSALYLPLFALMVWLYFGKQIRRWWRRRKLNIPNEEKDVKTISGPTWDVTWVKVSEAKEKHPDEQRSTVLGHGLREVIQVLKAKYGDEFDEQNVRSADKRSYSNVIVGIPEA
jgi:hypothetical protein